MRGALTATGQILGAGVAVAAIGGLVGLLIVELATSRSAATGLGWGMVVAGAIAGFSVGHSGSPAENMVGARFYGSQVWSGNPALPQSPLQIALGGILAFAGGIGVLILAF
jgi:hypothetical protein